MYLGVHLNSAMTHEALSGISTLWFCPGETLTSLYYFSMPWQQGLLLSSVETIAVHLQFRAEMPGQGLGPSREAAN
jgi:hypothetical protein